MAAGAALMPRASGSHLSAKPSLTKGGSVKKKKTETPPQARDGVPCAEPRSPNPACGPAALCRLRLPRGWESGCHCGFLVSGRGAVT